MNYRSTITLFTLITALSFCGIAGSACAFETRGESTEFSTPLYHEIDYQPVYHQLVSQDSHQRRLAKIQVTSTNFFGGDEDNARLRRSLKNSNRKIEQKVKDQYLSSALFSAKEFNFSGLHDVQNDELPVASSPALIRIRTIVLIC